MNTDSGRKDLLIGTVVGAIAAAVVGSLPVIATLALATWMSHAQAALVVAASLALLGAAFGFGLAAITESSDQYGPRRSR